MVRSLCVMLGIARLPHNSRVEIDASTGRQSSLRIAR
jgi:hypothetical protein